MRAGDTVILYPFVTCGLCRACRAGDDVHCTASEFPGISRDGGMAELLRTGVRSVVKLDEGLAPADVAASATPASRPTTRSARRFRCCTRGPTSS